MKKSLLISLGVIPRSLLQTEEHKVFQREAQLVSGTRAPLTRKVTPYSNTPLLAAEILYSSLYSEQQTPTFDDQT